MSAEGTENAHEPPDGLREAGRALWQAVCADLGTGWAFDHRELTILELAARQADLLAELEAALARDGLMVRGVAGQPRLNGAAVELRQGRTALARLLGELRLPDENGQPMTAAQLRGQSAARARWSRELTNAKRRERLNGASSS